MAYSAESKLLELDSSASASNAINARSLYLKKVGSALFYGIASFLITVVNKTVLTSWKFPSFLALSIGQMVAGIVILVSDFEHASIVNIDFSRQSIFFFFQLCRRWASNLVSLHMLIFQETYQENCFHCR